MRHLRPAEAAIDYAQRCHILTHSLPEIDAGATRENDHSALGRVRSVGLFESADGSFPEPRLPHRPESVAPNGTGNEKYDERCCNGSLHVETHTTGEYSICEFQKSSPDRFQMSVDSDRLAGRHVVSYERGDDRSHLCRCGADLSGRPTAKLRTASAS